MSRKAALGFAACLIIGLIFGYALGLSSVETRGLEQQVEVLQGQLADANNEIDSLASQVSALQSEIATLRGKLETQVLGVYFSPKGGCEAQVIYWISRANTSVHILMYSFTLDSISDELIEAHRRGVDVKVVFERQQITQHSEYQKLREAGIAVRNDTNSDLMHDKVMIVDGIIMITGSFNWSSAAENENNENLIVIHSSCIAAIHETEFTKIWNNSI